MARVIVVGAGVIGLSCAVRLAEAGHRVDVVARDLPKETTSAVAAALWYPYLAMPREQVTAWSARSFEVFSSLAALLSPGLGIALRIAAYFEVPVEVVFSTTPFPRIGERPA